MIISIATEVFVDAGDQDPEDVTREFALGISNALRPFPYDVLDTDVDNFRVLDDEEIVNRGLDES